MACLARSSFSAQSPDNLLDNRGRNRPGPYTEFGTREQRRRPRSIHTQPMKETRARKGDWSEISTFWVFFWKTFSWKKLLRLRLLKGPITCLRIFSLKCSPDRSFFALGCCKSQLLVFCFFFFITSHRQELLSLRLLQWPSTCELSHSFCYSFSI